MSTSRGLRSAAVLDDGRVLVAGGADAHGAPLATAEVYDPSTGQWTPTGALHHPHGDAVLVAVPGGAVLVGGEDPGQEALLERWSATTSAWTATIMPPFTSQPETAWWDGGRLLLLCKPEALLDQMQFRAVDLATGQLTALPSPSTARYSSMDCRLADGRLLLAAGISSGIGGDGQPAEHLTRECEVFDPVAVQWHPVGDLEEPHMHTDRGSQALVALADGGALVVSGTGVGEDTTDRVERFSGATGRWSTQQPLVEARDAHTTTVLADGSVLVVGGQGPGGVRTDCHLYDVDADSWSSADSLTTPRIVHVAVALADGRVLVIDGARDGSCELYS